MPQQPLLVLRDSGLILHRPDQRRPTPPPPAVGHPPLPPAGDRKKSDPPPPEIDLAAHPLPPLSKFMQFSLANFAPSGLPSMQTSHYALHPETRFKRHCSASGLNAAIKSAVPTENHVLPTSAKVGMFFSGGSTAHTRRMSTSELSFCSGVNGGVFGPRLNILEPSR